MVFYSLGSAFGATATTALFDAAGWTGSAVLGAALALCALVTAKGFTRSPMPGPGGGRRGTDLRASRC